jgi:peptidoglycan hydrolase-like protein with peptidoglycan-binding domain
MGIGKARSFACALVVFALVAALAPATPASGKKGKGKHPFGSRVLRTGMKGKDVRFLQRALSTIGVATRIDGAFGKGTKRSVKALEAQRGWQPVDGVVSKKDAGRIKKLLAKGRVSGGFYVQGYVRPTLTVTAKKAGSARVKVLDAAGNLVQAIPVSFSGAESRGVAWDGITATGAAAADGIYQLKLAESDTAGAFVSGGETQPFAIHLRGFPVPGTHGYGGAGSRFGAPRSGHTHQGQDVSAACGERLYVVETGTVSVNAYQASGAGYYVVLHGALSGTDYVYMHLKAASWAPAGTGVYAGQQIGKVGDTGDSQGCHLHFERWSAPGWYAGGAAYDPLPELQYWDSYS